MILDLLLYIGILGVGILFGYKEISHKKLLERLDVFQTIALVFILFVMGLRIGADEKVINSIQDLGIKALVYATFSILFSVLFVWIARKALKFNRKGVKS